MKSSSSFLQDKFQFLNSRRENCIITCPFLPLLLLFLGITTIFSVFLLYPPYPLKPQSKNTLDNHVNNINNKKDNGSCDLYKGHWIPDSRGPLYTNSSCKTIPVSKNCFMQGRQDRNFLNWRWKPDACELPRFDPKIFLEIVRGKKMAFIGDSVARNHMESLLCLLSPAETPIDAYKDSEDRFRIWHFPISKFTLIILWTKFLVSEEERVINGSSTNVFDLYLDKVDEEWTKDLPSVDIAIISDGHWLFRKIYLHQGDNIVGCIYCDEPDVTKYEPDHAFRLIFRSVLNYINVCKKCKNLITLLRTFSPAHFEDGRWDNGGTCNRTCPYTEEEINLTSYEWNLRKIQVEEVEKIKMHRSRGKKFEVLDITRAMLLRPDGHPGAYWGNKWMKGYNDCVHWCLPGPIDVWSEFLMAVLMRKKVGFRAWTRD